MENMITLVLPYYNERDYISSTIDSICNQDYRFFELVLVDNGSTDGSCELAKRRLEMYPDVTVSYLHEAMPGKIYALTKGMSDIRTKYVATVDADTIYPTGYIRKCVSLFEENPRSCAVLAIDIYDPLGSKLSKRRIRRISIASWIFRRKCHAGGYAQAFRTKFYQGCGGYDAGRWPYLLEDHEIIHKLSLLGPIIYSRDHYCFPSSRRSSRSNVGWNVVERLLYTITPTPMMDWYFYSFLARRFERRGLRSARLRQRDW